MFFKLLTELIIYTFSFKLVEYIKRGEFVFYSSDTNFLTLVLLAVVFSSIITGKLKSNKSEVFFENSRPIFKSLILSIGILTIYFNLYSDSQPSRLLISAAFGLGFVIEIIITALRSRISIKKSFNLAINFSPFLFLIEFILLTFLTAYPYLFYDTLSIEKEFYSVFLMYFLWFGSSLFVHQFSLPRNSKNYWHFIWARVKANLIFIALSSYLVYILIPENLSSLYPLYISIMFTIATFFINTIYFLWNAPVKTDEIQTKFIRATPLLDQPIIQNHSGSNEKYRIKGNPHNHYLAEQLANVYLKKYKEIFKFLDDSLELFSFDPRNSFMIKSADVYNIEVLPENKLEFYMNLHELNDIQRINKYLKAVNSKLIEGGVFVGAVEPLCLRREKFFKRYPFYIAYIFYFFDFIWKRMFPKIPLLKNIYFGLTKGKNRAISLSEIIGRIYFCGFSLLNLKQIGHLVYFIVLKKGIPSTDPNPSYGPFIKLKRVGHNGKHIYVYKFRTMYPYSEYLQKFIYEKTNLEKSGKFKDDFRITSWGKVLRKLWLDELPMFINYFKGELKLFGVRPLSLHYFSLYPDHLKKRRIKYKPGLVPPYYADLPQSFEEIIASEEKYLDSYEKNPFLTDVKYLFKAAYNIIIKRARSG